MRPINPLIQQRFQIFGTDIHIECRAKGLTTPAKTAHLIYPSKGMALRSLRLFSMTRCALSSKRKKKKAGLWAKAWPVLLDLVKVASPFMIWWLSHQEVVQQVPHVLLV